MGQELFILYCNSLPLTGRSYYSEQDVRAAAEALARNNKGAVVGYARIIAFVTEPLTPLQWTDGTPAGDGLSPFSQDIGYANAQAPCGGTVGSTMGLAKEVRKF